MNKPQDCFDRHANEIEPASLDSDNEEAQNFLDKIRHNHKHIIGEGIHK